MNEQNDKRNREATMSRKLKKANRIFPFLILIVLTSFLVSFTLTIIWVRVEAESLRWLAISLWMATLTVAVVSAVVWMLRRRWKRRKGAVRKRNVVIHPLSMTNPMNYHESPDTTST